MSIDICIVIVYIFFSQLYVITSGPVVQLSRADGIAFHGKINIPNLTVRVEDVSYEGCVDECNVRPSCTAVNYRRSYNLCELHLDPSPEVVSTTERGVLYWIKETQEDTVKCGTFSCTLGQVCNFQKNRCEVRECPPLSILNSTDIIGNINAIGSKIEMRCKEGFIAQGPSTINVTCGTDGVWRSEPLNCMAAHPSTTTDEATITTTHSLTTTTQRPTTTTQTSTTTTQASTTTPQTTTTTTQTSTTTTQVPTTTTQTPTTAIKPPAATTPTPTTTTNSPTTINHTPTTTTQAQATTTQTLSTTTQTLSTTTQTPARTTTQAPTSTTQTPTTTTTQAPTSTTQTPARTNPSPTTTTPFQFDCNNIYSKWTEAMPFDGPKFYVLISDNNTLSNDAADDLCSSQISELPKIRTVEKLDYYRNVILQCPGVVGKTYWVDGYNTVNGDGSWRTSDGVEIPLSQGEGGLWVTGRPNDGDTSLCLRLWYENEYRLDDFECNQSGVYYICERETLP